MTEPLIGILGSGGAVGSVACDILQHFFYIRGGQRHQPPKPIKKANYEWVHVDLYDTDSLANFCNGCEVILNCAGPSCRIGDRVARAAKEAGAYYVDVFGTGVLEPPLSGNIRDAEGVFVLSAGVFPGLSGVLPLWLSDQGFDTVDSIYGFAGGREFVSFGAAADLLLSSIKGFGIPGAYWSNGSVCRLPESSLEPVALPGFKDRVYIQPFLNDEMVHLSKQLKVGEIHWHSVYPDKQLMDAVLRGCCLLSVDESDRVLDRSVTELITIASMLMEGREPWYTLVTEVQGMIRGEIKRKRAILGSSSSCHLSGIIAAVTVQTILQQKPSEGVYWAFEVLDTKEVIAKVREEKTVDFFEVFDIPPTDLKEMPMHFNEGVI